MRRILTLFTGSKLATAAAAAALSVVTMATLVAGGIVVSRVVDSVGGEPLAARRPAIGRAQAPIVVRQTERLEGRPVRVLASDPSVPATPTGLAAAPKASTRTVALLDEADRVSGGVSAALDAEEPNRMEEVSTIERIESLIKDDSEDEEATSDEGETPDEGQTETPDEDQPEPPDDTEDPNKLDGDGPLQAVHEVTEPTTELIYPGTAAGSASPSV